MSDGKVPLVEKWSHADSCFAPHAIAASCQRCQLEQFWPVVEGLIAAGQAMRNDGFFDADKTVAMEKKAKARIEWDSAYAAYQAGRNGK